MAWGKQGADAFVTQMLKRLDENDPTLEALHILSFRKLSDADFVRLANAIARNTILKDFSASGHALSPAGLAAFSEALSNSKSLRSVCIGHAGLGDAGLSALEEGLSSSTLTVLDMEFKGLALLSAECIARVCQRQGALRELKLARNELCDASVRALVAGLTSAGLESLDLRENKFGEAGSLALAEYLASPSCRLRKLLLSGNALSPVGAAHIAKAIAPASTLQELSLDGCGVGDDGAAEVAAAAARAGALTTLILAECGITAVGAAAVARSLQPPSRIETLRLNGSPIADEGAAALAAACKGEGCAVRVVDVGKCGLTARALVAFVQTSLDALCLFGNRLTEGLDVLAEESVVHASTTWGLRDLDLGGNAIEESHAAIIIAWLSAPGVLPQLETLSLGGNTIKTDVWHAATEALRAARPRVRILY